MTAPLREQQIVLSDGAAVVSVTIEVHDYFALTGDDRDLLSDIVEIVQAANAKPEDEEPRLRVVPSTEVLEEIDSLAEFVDGLAEEPRGVPGPDVDVRHAHRWQLGPPTPEGTPGVCDCGDHKTFPPDADQAQSPMSRAMASRRLGAKPTPAAAPPGPKAPTGQGRKLWPALVEAMSFDEWLTCREIAALTGLTTQQAQNRTTSAFNAGAIDRDDTARGKVFRRKPGAVDA